MLQIALMVLPWLFAIAAGWLGLLVVRQNELIRLRLEAIEALLRGVGPTKPVGLAVGSPAPEIQLPALEGPIRRLDRHHGRRVLLVFFNPQCGFCLRMLDAIAALPLEGADGHPLPLIVTTGDQEENRILFHKYGVRCAVLIQEGMTTSEQYQVQGTPSGYLIDEDGMIASPLALGAEALLSLAGRDNRHRSPRKGRETHPANRPLSTSKLNRSGLRAGSPAPEFRLPSVGGGEIALTDYCGQRVLLVFSDPHCGPCDQLCRELERQYLAGVGAEILMISRGEPKANRQKVQQLRLTFPVALQKNWEISMLYGMFATPIAYLIDGQGVLASR